MSAPPNAGPGAAMPVVFPPAAVGVAGMTAQDVQRYMQLQADFHTDQIATSGLATLKQYVASIHRTYETNLLERYLSVRDSAAQAPTTAAKTVSATPATRTAATSVATAIAADSVFPPAAVGVAKFTAAHLSHYEELQAKHRSRLISRDDSNILQQYVKVLNKAKDRDPIDFAAKTAAAAQAPKKPAQWKAAPKKKPAAAASAKASKTKTTVAPATSGSSAASKSAASSASAKAAPAAPGSLTARRRAELAQFAPTAIASGPPPARKRKSDTHATTSAPSAHKSSASDPALIRLVVQVFDPTNGDGFRTLLALSRVSKAWRPPALQCLHTVVPIFSPQSPALGSLFGIMDYMRQLKLEKGDSSAKGKGKGKKGAAAEDSESEDEPGYEDEQGDGCAGRALDEPVKRLYHAYKKFPALAALPTELHFFGPFEYETSARAIRRFLRLCPNIRKLRLSYTQRGVESPYDHYNDPHSLVIFHAAEAQPLLQSLELARATERNWELIPALRKFKALKHLSLTFGEDGQAVELPAISERGSTKPPEPYPFQLESLELNSLVEQSLLDRLTESSEASLTYICVAVMREPLDVSAFPNLRKVAVVCGADMYKAVVETIKTMPDSVDSLEIRRTHTINGLEHQRRRYDSEEAELDAYYDDEFEEEQIEERKRLRAKEAARDKENTFSVLLDNLPTRIRCLSFLNYLTEIDPDSRDADKDEQIQLVAALARSDFLPNLVQLEVGNPATDDYWDEWESADRKWIRGRRKPLVAACAKRRIFLGPRERHWERALSEGGEVPRMM
ncbi:hypothetical protein JCM10908_007336 [Rhodotorula pacifica]|uniref:uncharacterized protein n=1 Tax=Rhodotorula pacifica TaxID=1495444 RepID=UPI003175445A